MSKSNDQDKNNEQDTKQPTGFGQWGIPNFLKQAA